MRRRERPTFARTSAIVGVVLGFVFVTTSACTGDAVGVEGVAQSRRSAAARAEVRGDRRHAEDQDAGRGRLQYRDHSLPVGIENTTDANVDNHNAAKKCTDVLTAIIACQTAKVATMADCKTVAVDDETMTPCEVFKSPEHATECAFIKTPAGTTVATSGAGGSGGSGGSGLSSVGST